MTLLVAWALMLSSVSAALDQGTSASETEPRPLMRIAVLPFQNGTGDAALDDWQHALPGLTRLFLKDAASFNVRGWKQIQPVLKHSGWNAKTNDAELARQIATDLKSSVVVWGQFVWRTNACVADLTVFQTNSAIAATNLQAISSNWVGLAESIAMRVAEHLGSPLAEDDRQYARSQLPESAEASVL